MLNLSVMPLDPEHIDHFAADIAEQQKSGASTHAMFKRRSVDFTLAEGVVTVSLALPAVTPKVLFLKS